MIMNWLIDWLVIIWWRSWVVIMRFDWWYFLFIMTMADDWLVTIDYEWLLIMILIVWDDDLSWLIMLDNVWWLPCWLTDWLVGWLMTVSVIIPIDSRAKYAASTFVLFTHCAFAPNYFLHSLSQFELAGKLYRPRGLLLYVCGKNLNW